MFQREKPESLIMVIFGASGDLTKRKLISAIYNLYIENLLPKYFAILGISRRLTQSSFQAWMRDGVSKYGDISEESVWQSFQKGLYALQADLYNKTSFDQLKDKLIQINLERNCAGNILYYLATAPSHQPTIINSLGEKGLQMGLDGGWARIIIEKPFGLDLASAIDLNRILNEFFEEDQIFRIDHYLGKEAIQNLLVFRFANIMFQPIWNRKFIDNIQITVAETLGVDKRANYFEQTGALRDMIQNHLLQILTFITMERPNSLHPDAIRDRKVELLRSIKRLDPDKVNEYCIRGQYDAGRITTPRSGDHIVVGYRSERGINPQSEVETFIALKIEINNERWDSVPIYLRTGKRLKKRLIEIDIKFRSEMFGIFRKEESRMEPNRLILQIQPNPSISLKLGWKPPGLLSDISPINLEFLGRPESLVEPKAYERLILDAMLNDKTLFIRQDEVEEAWRVIMPIIEGWKKIPPHEKFPNYKAGSQGPEIANKFIQKDGHQWSSLL